jgi:hypothetical protein
MTTEQSETLRLMLTRRSHPAMSMVEPAPEMRNTPLFSAVMSATASATDEVGTSTMASTPSASYHSRATLLPTSGLFWWSAETISTFSPLSAAPKSSTAMRVATTEPSPDRSA